MIVKCQSFPIYTIFYYTAFVSKLLTFATLNNLWLTQRLDVFWLLPTFAWSLKWINICCISSYINIGCFFIGTIFVSCSSICITIIVYLLTCASISCFFIHTNTISCFFHLCHHWLFFNFHHHYCLIFYYSLDRPSFGLNCFGRFLTWTTFS